MNTEFYFDVLAKALGLFISVILDGAIWLLAAGICFLVVVLFLVVAALINSYVLPLLKVKLPWEIDSERALGAIGAVSIIVTFPIFLTGADNALAEIRKRLNSDAPRQVIVGEEIRRMTLVRLDPPKHVYADLKDANSGIVYERQYVGKHCNRHRDNKAGDQYNVVVARYYMSNDPEKKEFFSFKNLYNVFCGE